MKLSFHSKVCSLLLIAAITVASCDQDFDSPTGPPPDNSHVPVLFYTTDTTFKTMDGYFTLGSSRIDLIDTNNHDILFRYTNPDCRDKNVDTVVKLTLQANTNYDIYTYKMTPTGPKFYSLRHLYYEHAACASFNLK